MTYELRPVTTEADWRAMHDIRRATLFTPDRHPGHVIVYDENHPHDHNPHNQPFLLMLDGAPIGVVRLDDRGSEGVVRLVAIVPELQARGHGRVLGRLVEEEARRRGMQRLMLNAFIGSIGFYEKMGWHAEVWDAAESTEYAGRSMQMTKSL